MTSSAELFQLVLSQAFPNIPKETIASCTPEIMRAAEVVLRSRQHRPTPPRMLVNQDLSEERYMEVTR